MVISTIVGGYRSRRGSGGIEALFQTGPGQSLSPLRAPRAPGTSLTNGHKAPLAWTASHDLLLPSADLTNLLCKRCEVLTPVLGADTFDYFLCRPETGWFQNRPLAMH